MKPLTKIFQKINKRYTIMASYVFVFLTSFIIRLLNIDRPYYLMFDEVHYVPDALAINRYGHEVGWWEKGDFKLSERWEQFQILTPNSMEYVSSHPPLGKTIIGLGMLGFDDLNPIGWRLSSVVAGALTAVLVMVLAQQVFNNRKISLTAGLFTVFSNFNAAMSSIAILDIFLGLFVLIGIIFTVAYLKNIPDKPTINLNLILAAIFLGLSMGIKWSAAYYILLAATIILTAELLKYLKTTATSKTLTVIKILIKNFIASLIIFTAYVATWVQHFFAYRLKTGNTWLEAIKAIYEWHIVSFNALAELSVQHNYGTHAQEWLWLARPTYFASASLENNTSIIITTLPNLILALLAGIGITAIVINFVKTKSFIPLILPSAVLAGWVPWLFYQERTIFFFYVAVFEPYLIIAAAWLIFQFRMKLLKNSLIILTLAYGAFQMPISVGQPVVNDSALYNLANSWEENIIRAGLYNLEQVEDPYYEELYEKGIVETPRLNATD